MRLPIFPMRCLALGALLSLAPACALKERIQPLYPPVADMIVQPKPRLDPAALGSEAALDQHDIAIETWGEAGWAAVARICRWAAAHGAPVTCPEAR